MNTIQPNYLKLVFAGILTLYFVSIALAPMQGSFLDLVDLPIHEAGHLLFSPFGQFIMVAGGTLFQLIVPAVFVGYFYWHFKYYSAAIVLFWLGQSLLNVWVYAADAKVMQLVLLGGLTGSEGSFHDWNYMLTTVGLLDSVGVVAGLIRIAATLTIIAAAGLSIYYSFVPTAEDEIDI
ncbi:MAG: hypothetical protein H0V76_07530 [Blastocatellia bacterium]|nr:hypothetical protein [Blastocatellia bacterium]